MTLATLGSFLLGNRQAILDVSATRRAWLVGIVLVLSAGLAREYDHEDLVHEPWHALLPLAASLVTATILFALIRIVSWRRSGSSWPPRGGYPSFLGLYWATAPLAWLYAIPVERFLPAEQAVAANLWLLLIVSVWRVLLMTRVVAVVWRCHGWGAFQIVGLFAWGVASAVLSHTPLPLLSIMGGIELAPAESILAETTFFVMVLLFLSTPLWLIGGLVVFFERPRADGPWTPHPAFASGSRRVEKSLRAGAGSAMAAGLALLPLTQPEQRLRREAEAGLRREDPTAAIRLMAAHARDDFPPHWDPPPRPGFGEQTPRLTDIVEAIATVDPPAWVREVFFAKALNAEYPTWSGGPLLRLDDEALARYVAALERLPEGKRLAVIHAESIDTVLRRGTSLAAELAPGSPRRDLLERVRSLAGSNDGEATQSPAK